MRILPPARGSASAFGLLHPCGPHQAARCFASVNMLNTSARGASNVRVMVISRCATGLAANLAAAVIRVPFAMDDLSRTTNRRAADRHLGVNFLPPRRLGLMLLKLRPNLPRWSLFSRAVSRALQRGVRRADRGIHSSR